MIRGDEHYRNIIVMYRLVIVFLSTIICLTAYSQTPQKLKSFSFTALGDMPYFVPDDYARFENVIKAINDQHTDFTIHVGDTKSSSTPCSDEFYVKMDNYFRQFDKPLIYTPGDNEWTDCDKKEAGAYNPQERLEVVRRIFFKDHLSYGKKKISLVSQSSTPAFSQFVENNLWDYGQVQFGTIHAVGTSNNKISTEPERMKEFEGRDAANLAWLDEIFDRATRTNKVAVVIALQADMFNVKKGIEGFETIIPKLTALCIRFGKPVLIINGDSHKFIVDKPILHPVDSKINKARIVQNVTRLQLFGEQDMHAVKITFDPSYPGYFRIEQLLVQGN